MSRVLALDLATRSGWAIARRTSQPLPAPTADIAARKSAAASYLSGVWQAPKVSGWLEYGRVFDRLERFLIRTIERYDISIVFVEGDLNQLVRYGQKMTAQTTVKLVGLFATLQRVCHAHKIEIRVVSTADMQAHLVGSRKDQDKVLRGTLGVALGITDDNQMDAIGVLSLALATLHSREEAS